MLIDHDIRHPSGLSLRLAQPTPPTPYIGMPFGSCVESCRTPRFPYVIMTTSLADQALIYTNIRTAIITLRLRERACQEQGQTFIACEQKLVRTPRALSALLLRVKQGLSHPVTQMHIDVPRSVHEVLNAIT